MAKLRYLMLFVLLIAFPACRANIPAQPQNLAPEISSTGLDIQVYYETKEVKSKLGSHRTEWRTLIDAPPKKVWAVLIDYENYPNLIPSATKYKIIERNGNSVVVETRGRHGFIKLRGTVRYVEDPDAFEIRWEKIQSKLNLNSGYWKLTPFEHDGRTATKLFHFVYSKPNTVERIGNMVGNLEKDEVVMIRKIRELAESQ
ncbi:MAG: hypothetical protein DRP79_06960 [Planctomycetota bacterium]|nr:MAG: hypothetical protein DRP79_06960 [Planctomycetota bacterium]